MKKDFNKIANLEKAISEKYGEEAIQNPKNFWNQEKEEKYLKELKIFYKKNIKQRKSIKFDGFTLKENKISNKHKIDRECKECGSYSFSSGDDLYMNKYDCCELCYIHYIEGREARWLSGWRPNQEK